MPSPACPPSETSAISPFRSVIFSCLVITSLFVTSASILNPRFFLPEFLVIALHFVLVPMYLISIIGSFILTCTDKTQHRAAMDFHFGISTILSMVLFLSKSIERRGYKKFTEEDVYLCLTLVIWMYSCGMLSAILVRGGVGGLKREVKAVPGNLWKFLYE